MFVITIQKKLENLNKTLNIREQNIKNNQPWVSNIHWINLTLRPEKESQ